MEDRLPRGHQFVAFSFFFTSFRWYGCAQGPLIEKEGRRSHASKSRDKAIVPRMRSDNRRPNNYTGSSEASRVGM